MLNKNIIGTISLGYGDSNSLATDARAVVRLDSASDEYAIVFRAQKDMTVNQVGLVVDNLVGSPTYLVSIQGVSASTGDPDGTIKGGGSPASSNWSPSATGLQWVTLDNSYNVSAEEVISIVVEDGTSGTNPDASNYVDMGSMDLQITKNTMPFQAISLDTGSTWSPIGQDLPAIALRNSSETNNVQGNPVETWHKVLPDNYGFASGHISACKFKIPTSRGRRFKAAGIFIKNAFFTGDISVGIYDSSGSEVVSGAQDKDISASSSGDLIIHFSTPVWIYTETQYYAGIKLTSAGLCSIYVHDMVTDDNTSACKGYPDFGVVSSLWNGSAWVDNVGQVPTEVTILLSEQDRNKVTSGGFIN